MAITERLITVDEFEAFIELPENADRTFELIDGEIIEKMPTERHGLTAGTLYGWLWSFITPRKLGRLVIEVRYRLPEHEHDSRIPDISFTLAERVQPVVDEGASPVFPDLAIEVQSPHDRVTKMREKAAYYLANGVKMVWLVLVKHKLVEVYRHGVDDVDILNIDQMLTGYELLPGFSMPVRAIFEE
jgi:Uma2 family endonuclease